MKLPSRERKGFDFAVKKLNYTRFPFCGVLLQLIQLTGDHDALPPCDQSSTAAQLSISIIGVLMLLCLVP